MGADMDIMGHRRNLTILISGLILAGAVPQLARAQDRPMMDMPMIMVPQPAPVPEDAAPPPGPATDPAAVLDVPASPEALKAENLNLKKQIKALKAERDGVQAERDSLTAKINEMTHPGGSLVKAYCADDLTSRNTAGAENRCTPYRCEPVSGLCRTSASASDQCAPGFLVLDGRCIHP
jgi:hypothetical protein